NVEVDRASLPAYRQKRCSSRVLYSRKRTQLAQRVFVEVRVAVRVGWLRSVGRNGKIGDEKMIVREAKVHSGKAVQAPDKKPGANHQQQCERDLRHDQRIAQQPGALAA